MTGIARVFAPAKLNLHLEVKNRRPDGFHEILSLFQAVTFGDTVQVARRGGSSVVLSGAFDCPPEKNTVVIAVREFLNAAGIDAGVEIAVEKHIPVQAGLGGGSSDAAAVIRALDVLFETRFSYQDLIRIGANVGSDVPFFLSGVAGIVSGRGESVLPISPRTDFFAVIVWPGFGISTQKAYQALDEVERRFPGFGLGCDDIMARYSGPVPDWNFGNSFQEVLELSNPGIAVVRREFLKWGAFMAMLSGSGSAVFGLFDNAAIADNALEKIQAVWPASFRANPLACFPSVVLA